MAPTRNTRSVKKAAAPAKKAAAVKRPAAPVGKKAVSKKTTSVETVTKEVNSMAAETDAETFLNFLRSMQGLIQDTIKHVQTGLPVDDDQEQPADDVSEVEATATDRESREAELDDLSLAELRKLVIGHGYDEAAVKAEKKKDVLIGAILDEEFGAASDDDEDDSDDDDESDDVDDDDTEDDEDSDDDEDEDEEGDEDDDDEDDGDGPLNRDDLMNMSLAELKKLAVNSYNFDASELKGLDKDSIADMILQPADGDEDDADEDEDGEEEPWTEEDLVDYSDDDLRELLDQNEIKYRKNAKRDSLIALIVG